MIAIYAYGLYDQYKVVDARSWGEDYSKRMIIPRGVVIPWLDENNDVRCVRVRRLPWDTSDEVRRYYGVDKDGNIGRYRALYGVSSAHFYQGHKIVPGCKVAVFEGEFTSVVAQEACKEQGIVCVATGSTSWCRNDANLRLLASCAQVLTCFDTDENQAGDNASAWWLDRLENAKRWRPLWGDANDMAIGGVDMQGWLLLGFEQDHDAATPASVQDQIADNQEGTKIVPNDGHLPLDLDQLAPLPDANAPDVLPELADQCTICGGEVETYRDDGKPYCASHLPHGPMPHMSDMPGQVHGCVHSFAMRCLTVTCPVN